MVSGFVTSPHDHQVRWPCSSRRSRSFESRGPRVSSGEAIRGPRDEEGGRRRPPAGRRPRRSGGEVTTAERLNYQAFEPERGRLVRQAILARAKGWAG